MSENRSSFFEEEKKDNTINNGIDVKDPMEELKAGVKQMTDGGLVEAIEQTKITLGILKAELMSR